MNSDTRGKEDMMSKDKYPSVLLKPNVIFRNTRDLKTREYPVSAVAFSYHSPDAWRPIARKRKYLMDNNMKYQYTTKHFTFFGKAPIRLITFRLLFTIIICVIK